MFFEINNRRSVRRLFGDKKRKRSYVVSDVLKTIDLEACSFSIREGLHINFVPS